MNIKKALFFLLLLVLLSSNIRGVIKKAIANDSPILQVVIEKIYLKDSLLIKSNSTAGITFYNIANPRNPTRLSTVSLVGNHDVAIQSEFLYADSYQNLIVYRINANASLVGVDTVKNVFNQSASRSVVPLPLVIGGDGDDYFACDGCNDDTETAVQQNTQSGQGGSLARFAVVDNYLYCIDFSTLKVFDITNPATPQFKNSIEVSWEIETLFGYKEALFIGGARGMYLYSIADRNNPTYLSAFIHARACDPVVVEDSLAYITLRGGTTCGQVANELHIVDVKQLTSPVLLKSYPLTNPYGLTVKDKIVYLCDGVSGLKILDASNLSQIQVKSALSSFQPYDAILRNSTLFITAQNQLLIYDVTNPTTPMLLSAFN